MAKPRSSRCPGGGSPAWEVPLRRVPALSRSRLRFLRNWSPQAMRWGLASRMLVGGYVGALSFPKIGIRLCWELKNVPTLRARLRET